MQARRLHHKPNIHRRRAATARGASGRRSAAIVEAILFPSLLAFGFDTSGAKDWITNGLAVGGGFLIGYFLGSFVAWALDRWAFAQKAPAMLKKTIAILSGVALATLVALLLFSESGKGPGGGGDNKGESDSDNGKQKAPPETPKEDLPKPPTKKDQPPAPTLGDVHVTILGGSEVQAGRFYQIDDDPTPKTFEEFKKVIDAKRKASKTELTIIFRFKKDALSDTHPAVRQAVKWVNEEKLLNRFE